MKGRGDNPYGLYVAPSTTRPSVVHGLRIQDPEKWEDFVRLYGPWVFRRAVSRIGNPDEAADVAQCVFVSVLKGLPRFQRDGEASFRRWLNSLTEARIADHFRRMGKTRRAFGHQQGLADVDVDCLTTSESGHPSRRELHAREPLSDDPSHDRAGGALGWESEDDDGEGPREPTADQALVQQGLNLLQGRFGTRTLEAIRLRLVERLPASEVAERLGMTPGAVHIAVSRVRKALRELLAGPPPGTFGGDPE